MMESESAKPADTGAQTASTDGNAPAAKEYPPVYDYLTTSAEQYERTPQQLVETGVCPINKKFLKQPESSQKTGEGRNDDGEEKKREVEEGEKQERPGKRRKRGGQNKGRRNVELMKLGTELQLCSQLATSGECKFGDECKRNHNVEEFLKNRPKDLLDTCHLFEKYGRCRFGLNCRFAEVHLADGKNVVLTEKYKGPEAQELEELNKLSHDIQVKLRKKQYEFKRTERVIRERSERKQQEEQKDIDETKTDADLGKLRPDEKKKLDLKGKLYLAPLTTVGNLPFRYVCKTLGADITCGEMAMAEDIVKGQSSEWALLRKHKIEDCFGVQICGHNPEMLAKCSELIENECQVDIVDINCGCPIDLVCHRGAGASIMKSRTKMEAIVRTVSSAINIPMTVKIRTGWETKKPIAHNLVPALGEWGASAVTIHGRSRLQRYTKLANWEYIDEVSRVAKIPLLGNGDIFAYEQAEKYFALPHVSGLMVARGALMKPWVFTEIKEKRNWDISASERLDLLKTYANVGLDHWGSDTRGVHNTRRFMMEWLSFLHRYVPVGLLEILPQQMNLKPLPYYGRNDLETLMASPDCRDWVRITEMILGPAEPEWFKFVPKHKSNSYEQDATTPAAEVQG